MNEKAGEAPCFERIAMVLQGGGALGAYQVGLFEALEEAGYEPHWLAGTSIGAINAAIIAGSPADERLARLNRFWETVSRPRFPPLIPLADDRLDAYWGSFQAAVAGQPGFFRPRLLNPWLAPPGSPSALSYYDTGELAETLAALIGFHRLNSGAQRISLGAVEVASGRQVYFDSARERIRVEHVLASGALPPGFPPVEIDGKTYWDGGIVSNTPLNTVLDDHPRVSTLAFVVDVFDPQGAAPRTMDEALARRKDITYASRSECNIRAYQAMHDLRRVVNELWSRLPADAQADPEARELCDYGCTTTMNIVHFVYRVGEDETSTKDYNFSPAAIARHRAAGHRDGARAIAAKPWSAPVPPHRGVMVHEIAGAAV